MNDFIAEEDEEEGYDDDMGDRYVQEAPRRGRVAKGMADILPQGLSEE